MVWSRTPLMERRFTETNAYWTGLTLLLMIAASAIIVGALVVLPPLKAVAVVAVLILCAVILTFPFAGLLLFLSFLYVRPELLFPDIPDLHAPLVLSSLTLFGWIINVVLKRETFRWRPEFGWMLLFTVFVVLSTYRLAGSGPVVHAILDMAKMVFLLHLLQQLLNTEKRANIAVQWILALTVIVALISIHGWFTRSLVLMEHGRPRAIAGPGLDEPNYLASVLVVSIPLALILCLRGTSTPQRVWGWIAFSILMLNTYLTNSRGGMLALALGMAVFLVHHVGWTKGILLAAMALVVMVVFGPDRFSPKVHGDDSAIGRLMAWQAGLRMFEESPILGVGYDQFIERHPLTAHNSFMLALAESGFLGSMAWLGLNYWAVLTLSRVRRAQRLDPSPGFVLEYGAPLQAGLLAALTAGLFLSHTYNLFPLIAVGLASALGGLAPPVEPRPRNSYHLALVVALTIVGVYLMYAMAKVQL